VHQRKCTLFGLPSFWAQVQIPSGGNRVKMSGNSGKLEIFNKLSCHHVCLSHLSPAIIGGALSQPVLHWASQEAPYGALKTGSVFHHHCNVLSMISAVKLA
jgi:hypothetical protein